MLATVVTEETADSDWDWDSLDAPNRVEFGGSFAEFVEHFRSTLSLFPLRTPGVVRIEEKDLFFADFQAFWRQVYELFDLRLYATKLTVSKPTILDAGAHVGLASLFFAHEFEGASIVGYEADSALCNLARKNIQSFGLSDRVELESKALWSHDRGVGFHSKGDETGRVHFASEKIVYTEAFGDAIVRCCPDLLKLDVGGDEVSLLSPLVENNHRLPSQMVLRMDGEEICRSESTKLFAALENRGYSLRPHTPAFWGSQDISNEESECPFRSNRSMGRSVVYAWRKPAAKVAGGFESDPPRDRGVNEAKLGWLSRQGDSQAVLDLVGRFNAQGEESMMVRGTRALALAREGFTDEALERLGNPGDDASDRAWQLFRNEIRALKNKTLMVSSWPTMEADYLKLFVQEALAHGDQTVQEAAFGSENSGRRFSKESPWRIRTHDSLEKAVDGRFFLLLVHPLESYWRWHRSLPLHLEEGMKDVGYLRRWIEVAETNLRCLASLPHPFVMTLGRLRSKAEKLPQAIVGHLGMASKDSLCSGFNQTEVRRLVKASHGLSVTIREAFDLKKDGPWLEQTLSTEARELLRLVALPIYEQLLSFESMKPLPCPSEA